MQNIRNQKLKIQMQNKRNKFIKRKFRNLNVAN